MKRTDMTRAHDQFIDACAHIKTVDEALAMLSAVAAHCKGIEDDDAVLVFNFTWDAIEKIQALRKLLRP